MPKKPRLIEPIKGTMQQIVKSMFAKDTKPRKFIKPKSKKKKLYLFIVGALDFPSLTTRVLRVFCNYCNDAITAFNSGSATRFP